MKIDENVKKAIVHCVGGEGCVNCPYEFVDGCSAIEPLLYDINQLAIENAELRLEIEKWRAVVDELNKGEELWRELFAKNQSEWETAYEKLEVEADELRDNIACLENDLEIAKTSTASKMRRKILEACNLISQKDFTLAEVEYHLDKVMSEMLEDI